MAMDTQQDNGTIILISMSTSTDLSEATETYLSNALSTSKVLSLHILSPSSYTLKTLKMSAYATAGHLARNLSVTTHELTSEEGASAARILESKLSEITSLHSNLHGVLLSLPTASSIQSHPQMALLPNSAIDGPLTGSISFLDSDTALLKTAFACTTLLIHSAARATLSHLRKRSQIITNGRDTAHSGGSGAVEWKLHNGPFFAVINSASPSLGPRQQASDFHAQLASLALQEVSLAAGGAVNVGHAGEVVPRPASSQQQGVMPGVDGSEQTRVDEKMGGKVPRLSIPTMSPTTGEYDEDASPTKLWSAWAMQEDA